MKLNLILALLALGPANTILAAPGQLDVSFGDGGKVTTAFSDGDGAWNVVMQSDGKLLAVGTSGTWVDGVGLYSFMSLVRYTAAGAMDASFGNGGMAFHEISGSDSGCGVAVQSDGKIVVAGSTFGSSGNRELAVIRFTSAGAVDAGFGTGGKVVTPVGLNAEGMSMAVQSDGKIVVAGYALNGSGNDDFVLVRYTSVGALDTAFGTGGKVTTPVGLGAVGYSLAVQSDGKIVVGGHALNSNGDNDFALVRYTASGTLDTSFGSGGKVVTSFGSSDDYGYSVAIQSDGKIVLAGTASISNNGDFALARYTATGALDTSFGIGGKLTTPVGSNFDDGRSVEVQSDGKIVVAGKSYNGSNYDIALTRYTASGAVDSSFGTGGKVTTSIGSGDDEALGSTLQTDGKIVVAGRSMSGTKETFAVVRYLADQSPAVGLAGVNSITATSASLQGTVNPNGLAATAHFEYGPTTAFGSTASVTLSPNNGSIAQNVSVGIAGLTADTQYYYRLTATNSAGTSTTTNGTFATLVLPPVVSTSPPASITGNSATLNGTVNPNGGATTASFQYGLTIALGSTAGVTLSPANGSTAQNVSANITGLAADTQYYYRLTATNAGGTSTTSTGTFATLLPPPVVATTATTAITKTSATLNGSVNPSGLATTAQFQFGPTTGYGSTFPVSLSPNNGTSAQSVSAFPSALLPGATYHYRLTATSSSGTSTTADATLRTLDPGGSSTLSGWPVMVAAGAGLGDDEGRGVAVDAAGNVAVVGSVRNATDDLYVAKYSPAGALVWHVTYDHPAHHGQDIGRSVAFDTSGNVVVTGHTYNGANGSGGTELDVYTAKYAAADGTLLWQRLYNNPAASSDDRGLCVAVDANGDVVINGYSFRASGNQDYYTAKYAGATGVVMWEAAYNGLANGSDIATAMTLDSSGNAVVTGYSANSSSNMDFVTVKYDGATGSKIWEHRYNGPAAQNDYASHLSVEPSGRVLVTGESQNADGSYDMHTLKIGSSTGSLIWERRFNGVASLNDAGNRIVVDTAGDVLVAGTTTAGPGNPDFYTAKYEGSSGAILWERTYNGSGNAEDVPTQLLLAPNGDVFVTGYSRGGDVDYLTLRYRGSDGLPLHSARTQGPGSGGDYPAGGIRGTALMPGGWPVVTGKALGLSGEFEIMTVAYGGPPTVVTQSPANITSSTANLKGTVYPAGVASAAWFEYGTTTSYGMSTPTVSLESGLTEASLTNLVSLLPNTLYHFRIAAQNTNGTAYGADMTVTTLGGGPEIRLFAGADDTAPELADGQAGALDYGTTPFGTPVTRSFTVKNVGATDLHVTGIMLPAQYEHVGSFTPVTVAANATHTFAVRFLANVFIGNPGGLLTLSSDDANEGLFELLVTGKVVSSNSVTGFAGFVVNGTASVNGANSVLTITNGTQGEFNSAFFPMPRNISRFSVSFTYQASGFGGSGPADGMGFVMQNDPRGTSSVGWGGSYLGYGGGASITPSAAWLLNIYQGGRDGVATGGVMPSYTPTTPVDPLSSRPVQVYLDYEDTTLYWTVTEQGGATYSRQAAINLPTAVGGAAALLGFTGSTGNGWSVQAISSFVYEDRSYPLLHTNAASNVMAATVTLNGSANPRGLATTGWYEYGTTTAYGSVTAAQGLGSGSDQTTFSANLAGLAPLTTYHFRALAQNATGTVVGADMNFTTLTMQQSWRQQYFGTASNTGNAADTFDYDADGLSNLLERACNLNPTIASTLPVTTARNGTVFEFTYSRSVDALNAGTVFVVEWSDTLSGPNWSSGGVTEQILSDNSTVQTVKASVPVGSNGRRFVHLKVSEP